METDRSKMIQQTLLQMDKQFGKGAVLQLGLRNVQAVTVISTGSISVDAALGVGGFPRGRVEGPGPESRAGHVVIVAVEGACRRRNRRPSTPSTPRSHLRNWACIAASPGFAADYGSRLPEITSALVSGRDAVWWIGGAWCPKPSSGDAGDSFMGLHAPDVGPCKITSAVAHQYLYGFYQGAREDRRHVRQPENHHRGRALVTCPCASKFAGCPRS
jgi:recombination protein RecA